MVTSSREGREMKDQDHKSRDQEDKTKRPQAPLEPRGGSDSITLDPGPLQEATKEENSPDPPTQGTIQMVYDCCTEKERQPATTEERQEENTQESPRMM